MQILLAFSVCLLKWNRYVCPLNFNWKVFLLHEHIQYINIMFSNKHYACKERWCMFNNFHGKKKLSIMYYVIDNTLNFDTISNHLNYNNVYFINLKTFFTYIFGIWILSASFCRPKSCHGLDRVVAGLLLIEVVGLFGPPCTLTFPRCNPVTDTGIAPLSSPIGWHSSV